MLCFYIKLHKVTSYSIFLLRYNIFYNIDESILHKNIIIKLIIRWTRW